MNGLIAQIEKGKPFFEKISRNIYLRAIVMVSSLECQSSCFQVSLS